MMYYWGLNNTGNHRAAGESFGEASLHSLILLAQLTHKLLSQYFMWKSLRSKAAAGTLHTKTLHQTFTALRAVWAARLLWQGPGCVAKIDTESFTDVFCTLTQTMNSPGRPKKIKEMVKTWWKAFLFKIISSIEKVTIAFININMEFPYSDHFPIWNGERVTHRV